MTSLFARFLLVFITAIGTAAPVLASEDAAFFKSVEGKWQGPGEIVAGKYKGTKFVCTLDGTAPGGKTGISMDGTSWRFNKYAERAAEF